MHRLVEISIHTNNLEQMHTFIYMIKNNNGVRTMMCTGRRGAGVFRGTVAREPRAPSADVLQKCGKRKCRNSRRISLPTTTLGIKTVYTTDPSILPSPLII